MALTQLKTGAIADDAVTTDKLANAINTERTANTAKVSLEDNAVTLAKMAGGTDGQIITYDASGDPVAVGPGTDGQVLTSTGAGSPPAFEALPAGTTINNNADNRVITGSGTANTLNGESTLTYSSNTLLSTSDNFVIKSIDTNASNSENYIQFNAGYITYDSDASDATGYSGHYFQADGAEKLRINGSGQLIFDADTNTYLARPAADTFAFTTGGTERMRIDADGIVTKPNQPSFSAYSTGNWTHGSDTGYLNLDHITTELFDNGGNYNTSTGVFTAPVAGKYFFTLTYAYINTSGYLVIYLQKGVSGTYNEYGAMDVWVPQQSSAYQGSPIMGVIDLAAGNTVRPIVQLNYAGNILSNTHFSGYLIG